jgi:hypothetical protein
MDFDYLFLVAEGIAVLIVALWLGKKSPKMAIALFLLMMQAILLAFGLDISGRKVLAEVIKNKGAVAEVSGALMALKDLQWPMRISIWLCGLGLAIQVVVSAFRDKRRARQEQNLVAPTIPDEPKPGSS